VHRTLFWVVFRHPGTWFEGLHHCFELWTYWAKLHVTLEIMNLHTLYMCTNLPVYVLLLTACNLAAYKPAILIVWHSIKKIPRPEFSPLVTSSMRADSLTLSLVIWTLFSSSSCYKGFTRSKNKQKWHYWPDETCNFNTSKTWNH